MSNRSKFVTKLAEKLDTTKTASDKLLLAFTEVLQEQLTEEGQAVFPGFGRLKVQTRAARTGRNPRTGDVISIPEKQAYKFKAFP
jgi:DNA-binding protein HU-beta